MTKNKIKGGIAAGAIGLTLIIGIKAGEEYNIDRARRTPVGTIMVQHLEAESVEQHTKWSFIKDDSDFISYNESTGKYRGIKDEKTGNAKNTMSLDGSTSTQYEKIVTTTMYTEGETKEVSINEFGDIIDESSIEKPYVIIKKID